MELNDLMLIVTKRQALDERNASHCREILSEA